MADPTAPVDPVDPEDPLFGAPETGTAREILLAALDLFAEHGYPATSIRAIAGAVGIQSASLYDHFRSKGHILARLVTIGHEHLLGALEEALAEAGDDPTEQVAAMVRADVLAHARHPRLARVSNAELERIPAELAGPAREARQRGEELALEVYERGRAAGVFDVPNPVAALAAIGSMGIRVPHWFVESEAYGPTELADDYAVLALRVLRGT